MRLLVFMAGRGRLMIITRLEVSLMKRKSWGFVAAIGSAGEFAPTVMLLVGAACQLTLTTNNSVSAATLFESGTLGPVGISWNNISGGSNVSPVVYVGVRFYIEQPTVTSQIGGHFVKNVGAEASAFGAIVALKGPDDFPDSGNLSTPDVVGSTLINLPELSNEVHGSLSKSLSPGWYALVFGSGLFGASGSGGALNNGVDIGEPAYIAFQLGSGFGWSNLEGFLSNFRFVVQGDTVPEPKAMGLKSMAVASIFLMRSVRRQ